MKKEQKGFFSPKKAFSYTTLSMILNAGGAAQKSHLNSKLSRNWRLGTASSPRKTSFLFGGEGDPAEVNVAGVMEHRVFHQTFACNEEKPWLFVGAEVRWDG